MATAFSVYGEKDREYHEYTVKGVFIGKFTEFIAWPKEDDESRKNFIITIVGDNPFDKELEKIYLKHQIKGVDVVVQYHSIEQKLVHLKKSDIIFISGISDQLLSKVVVKFRQKPVLLIGDTPGYCLKGVHINFFLKKDQIRFEINPDYFKRSKLHIHYRLLQLAKIVMESK